MPDVLSFAEAHPHIINSLSVIFTALLTWWVSRRKDNRDDKKSESDVMQQEFSALVKANTEFRLEIRGDLEKTRQELNAAHEEIDKLRIEMRAKDGLIIILQGQVIELTIKLKALEAK